MVTDPIADLLVRIQNGGRVRKSELVLPHSKLKEAVVRIFADCGYLDGFRVAEDGGRKELVLKIKYDASARPFIKGIKRLSSPGTHYYVTCDALKRNIRKKSMLGVVSTSRGLLPHRQALKQHLGGELLLLIW